MSQPSTVVLLRFPTKPRHGHPQIGKLGLIPMGSTSGHPGPGHPSAKHTAEFAGMSSGCPRTTRPGRPGDSEGWKGLQVEVSLLGSDGMKSKTACFFCYEKRFFQQFLGGSDLKQEEDKKKNTKRRTKRTCLKHTNRTQLVKVMFDLAQSKESQ